METRLQCERVFSFLCKQMVADIQNKYQAVIGLEVHIQLQTQSKLFCSDSAEFGGAPNTHVSAITLAHPGTLPVLNKKAIEYAVKLGLVLNCKMAPQTFFDRKHYFYPDLPKGYQTSQHNAPVCMGGELKIDAGNQKRIIKINHIHLEEDAGKNIHAEFTNESFVDFNRTGTPLLEIVSYPDIESAFEAKAYLKALRAIVQSLGISTGNMEEGSFRADTNISVRKKDDPILGTRCELKNINSFKFIGDAVEYEIERHILLLQEGKTVTQQTRLWDTKHKVTQPMRSKEEAADYRYFIDPDLPLLSIDKAMIESIKAVMPELPQARAHRLMNDYGLTPYEVEVLTDDNDYVVYFEAARAITKSKHLIHWIIRDLMGYAKEHKISISACKLTPQKLGALVELIESGALNAQGAKIIFEDIAVSGKDPKVIMQEKNLEQITDTSELENIIKEIIATNESMVAGYRSGKDKLFGFFVGLAMQKTQGKGDPKIIAELLRKHLNA